MRFAFIPLLLSLCISLSGQMDAMTIVKKSIKFHDPKGSLSKKDCTFEFNETRPNLPSRKATLKMNIPKEKFAVIRNDGDNEILLTVDQGLAQAFVNGSKDISEENKKKYRIDNNRTIFMKDYYRYLWLMPMAIEDPGSIVHPRADLKDFFGKNLYRVKVTYEPEIGKDVWYFYFNPKTFALEGYRFYHDEKANDGEYILFNNLVQSKGVKIPAERTWYTHKEDKLLGTDILEKIILK